MKRKNYSFWLLLFPAVLFSQSFTNVAPVYGITQSFGAGELGGGVSFADFDGDGLDDLTFTSQSGSPLYFFQNNGSGFTNLGALVTETNESKEAIWVDYDGDGDKDLFVTNYQAQNRLYEHTGNLVLTDVTATSGLSTSSRPSFGAAWGDYNKDGWLDLYVCNLTYESTETNELYLNDGDGTFTNVSSDTPANNGINPSFDAVFVDYDKDGWPDIYVANDKYGVPNAMYHNEGDGTFTDATSSTGTGASIDAMNAGGSDYDNDGYIDLYVSNTQGGNVLYANNGNGTFTDATNTAGVAFNRVGWASTFFDYDNDMDKDLYVSCVSSNMSEPNAMYVNQGDGTFTEPLKNSGGLGGSDYGFSFGHAIGDVNNDGLLDIAVSQMSHPNLLWLNQESNSDNWIKIKLQGNSSNADGVGAFIEVWANNVQQIRYTHCSMGYLGQNSDNYHFGLGSTNIIDSIIIRWPSGVVDKYVDYVNLNGRRTFAESNAPLPVEFLAFELSSSNTGIDLDWSTAKEIQTSHFEIERSYDGRTFQKIETTNASGNSSVKQSYHHLDANADLFKQIFYRLKIVDYDGYYEYSPIRSISAEDHELPAFSVLKSPQNPMRNEDINLVVNSQILTPMDIALFTKSGQLIQQKQIDLLDGDNNISWSLSSLPAASYTLRLSTDQLMKSYQIVKL